MSESLRHLAVFGIWWTSISTVVVQALSIVRVTLVARWLGPEDVGLYGFAMATVAGIAVISQFGLHPAFISLSPSTSHRPGDWLNSTWTLNLLFGLAATGIAALAAYPASLFLEEGRLISILLVISLLPTMVSLQSPGIMLAKKNAKFHGLATFEVLKAVLQAGLVLGLTWKFRSVWSLVYGNLIAEIGGVLLSYGLFSRRPRFRLERQVVSQLVSFGKHFLFIAMLTYVTTQFDDLIVGAHLGLERLGVYVIAYRLAMVPVGVIGTVVSRVMLPVYRKAVDVSKQRLEATWFQVFCLIPWVLLAMLLPIGLYAEWIVKVLLGEQWHLAGRVTQFLTVAAACRGVVHGVTPAMLVLKQPAADARYKFIETIVFIPTLLLGVHFWALPGAALAAGISYGLAMILRICWASKWLNVPLLRIGSALFWPLLVAAVFIAARGFGIEIVSSPVSGTLVILISSGAAIAFLRYKRTRA